MHSCSDPPSCAPGSLSPVPRRSDSTFAKSSTPPQDVLSTPQPVKIRGQTLTPTRTMRIGAMEATKESPVPKERSPVSQELKEFEFKVQEEGLLQEETKSVSLVADGADILEPSVTAAGDTTSEVKIKGVGPQGDTHPTLVADQLVSDEHPSLEQEPSLPETGEPPPLPNSYSMHSFPEGLAYPTPEGRPPYTTQYNSPYAHPPHGYYPPYCYPPNTYHPTHDKVAKENEGKHPAPLGYYGYPPPHYGYYPHYPPFGGYGCPPSYSPERNPPAPFAGGSKEIAEKPSTVITVRVECGEKLREEKPETKVDAPIDATLATVGGAVSPVPGAERGISPLTPGDKADETKDILSTAAAGVMSPNHGTFVPPPYYPPPQHAPYPPSYYSYGPNSGGYHYPPHGYPPSTPTYHPPYPSDGPYGFPHGPPPLSTISDHGSGSQSPDGQVDRKGRKNGQARQRSAHIRQRMAEIEAKPAYERTAEEKELLRRFIDRREHKNTQSRQRALLKKEQEAYILSKPESERSPEEEAWLDEHTCKRKRKHQGDRLRRQRIKELGISTRSGQKPGISARGPLPPQYEAILQEKGIPQGAA